MTRTARLLVALLFGACSSPDAARDPCGTAVRIERADDAAVVLQVCARRAVTEQERVTGLSDTESLPDTRGLLLELPLETEACIQNGPVSFAIDVVYASEAGVVAAVERSVAAGDATARCHDGVKRVLEVNASVAAAVNVGDRLSAASE